MTTQGDPEGDAVLRLRITHIATTMSQPLPTLRQHYVPSTLPTAVPLGLIPNQLPVIRIFGTTSVLQKICVNVHLCYPYFFVPFPMDSVDPLRPERVIRICQRFAVSLNHAICLALRQNPINTSAGYGGGTDPKHLHVVSVMLVKGIPFYGYHIGYSYFLKVSLVNPSRLFVAIEQLRKPVVLGREWQPHEAHLGHVLQFMCDFDLYGCGWLNLSGGTFRDPLPEGDPYDSPRRGIFNSLTTPGDMIYPAAVSPPKDTFSPLEIDVLPHQIINRHRLTPRHLHQDFVELLHQPLDPEEKLVPAMRELWEDERRRRVSKGLGTSEAAMLPVSGGGRGRTMVELGYKVEGDNTVENKGGDWKISEELWGLLEQRMAAERKRQGSLTFERFSRDVKVGKEGEKMKYDKWIMTTFDAVSAHWPKSARPLTQRSRRSMKGSSVGMSSPAPGRQPLSSSPVLPRSSFPEDPVLDDGVDLPEDEIDEEDNPFEIIASQASQSARVMAEIDASAVQLDIIDDIEEEDPEREIHDKAARHHAQEGQRFRSTQQQLNNDDKVNDEFDDLDDAEYDELFRAVIGGGDDSVASTPQKNRTTTPTSIATGSTGRRRATRNRFLAEKAGFGDLSTIMDQSPISLSSPTSNPYVHPTTPTKTRKTDSGTPTSLVRNIFARALASPLESPTKRTNANVIMLPPVKKSLSTLLSSPEDSDTIVRKQSPREDTTMQTESIREIRARGADVVPPIAQVVRHSQTSHEDHVKRSLPSPTLLNEEPSEKRIRLSSLPAVNKPLLSNSQRSSRQESIPQGSTPRISGSVATAWQFIVPPPSCHDVIDTLEAYDLAPVEYQEPYYSNSADIPSRAKLFAGRIFTVKGNDVADLAEYESHAFFESKWLKTRSSDPVRARYGWEYCPPPPSNRQVKEYCAKEDQSAAIQVSQLANPTQKSKYGFKFSQKTKSKSAAREHQNMSVLSLEVFAPSRHQLLPDPEKDEVSAVFFCYQNEDDALDDTTSHLGYHAGYVVVDGPQTEGGRARLVGIPCHYVDSELDLINWVIDIVKSWDPDILAGWELHNASWGYLAARAHQAFGTVLSEDISRVLTGHHKAGHDAYSEHKTSNFKVAGRHVLNIWRIVRSEMTLNQYSFENVVFQLLHQRIPRYSAPKLTALWKSMVAEHTSRVLHYFFQRVVIYAELVDAAEIVTKNAEFARVFGVDFDAVMFRGSQFKVESFMFRIAKPESFVMVSPSKKQVGLQNAPFAVPLIAEPESKYYTHPIVVLDFQSLYPSVMIAYNICFSTCLGRVEKFKGTDKFGFTELKVADGLLELLKDYLTVTPNGMIFVKPAVRKSLLAKMLGEILDTRVMVKQAMKGARGDKALSQMLNARQLGLKLMANVTYGYTSATFSGRMPCIEVADSIVQTGRETLEKAQELIHSREDWNAKVVYGDTDSLFIALPGRSKEQAFKIGHDIADTVTGMNPKPIKLKFEKVYMGSVLMAKKRYVGFKYEHPDEVEPVFDAKGIETIRRDGFPAQQKIEEVCLKMLFRSQDLSEIKEFCRQEWTKILQGRVSLQDFIVAKEVRLGTYSEKGVPPPGAAVAYRRILKDPRDEPQYAERVPYIVSNAEGRRLIDRARMPEEMIASRSLGIDAEYYIRNLLIPPLSRIFNLVGADVEQWFDSMPRTKRVGRYNGGGKMRIDSHFRSNHCILCGVDSTTSLCQECRSAPDTTAHALLCREHLAQERVAAFQRICSSCASTPVHEAILCDSIDCPVTYARVAAEREAQDVSGVRDLISDISCTFIP